MITVLVHIANAESVKLDLDELPKTTDLMVIGKNPRERNDKEVTWTEEGVTTVMFPVWRVTLIEVLPADEEQDEFPLPFRND